MKIYVIKRRGNPGVSYRGNGCYCSSIVDAILYDRPIDAFVAVRELKNGLNINNDAPDVYVAELDFSDTEVIISVVPVKTGRGFTA